jgi:hypothetical protein
MCAQEAELREKRNSANRCSMNLKVAQSIAAKSAAFTGARILEHFDYFDGRTRGMSIAQPRSVCKARRQVTPEVAKAGVRASEGHPIELRFVSERAVACPASRTHSRS